MKWQRIKALSDLPMKPCRKDYEQIDCLIWHEGEAKYAVWNCEHEVWDDAEGDDYFCDPLEPTHFMIIEAPEDA